MTLGTKGGKICVFERDAEVFHLASSGLPLDGLPRRTLTKAPLLLFVAESERKLGSF